MEYAPNVSLIVTPLLLLPFIIGDSASPESKCTYMVLLMAVFWTLNPIPMPITSLFPIVLLPLLGLASTDEACRSYFKANNMLFFGCLTLALAIEKSNLHQRIALKILLNISAKFSLIALCFMVTTMCFSMWIVSTATVVMMLPIADEIFHNLFTSIDQTKAPKPLTSQKSFESESNGQVISINGSGQQLDSVKVYNNNPVKVTIQEPEEQMEKLSEEEKTRICKMFYLCLAYAGTIGSVSTLTANGPNLIMKEILENQFDNRDPVDYASWIVFATPASILICILCWAIFSRMYFNNLTMSKSRQQVLRQQIGKKYANLGPITFHEWSVLFCFLIMILLYMFYKPQFIAGWSALFDENSNVPKPASAAILAVILLFLIPAKPGGNPDLRNGALLDWHTIQTKLKWGVLFIRGGGFAMADAVKSSGLSNVVGNQLAQLGTVLPIPALILSISVVANFVIEFMRSSATASILYPVAIKLAEVLALNPLKIVIPMGTACAYAFISPVGTTTNTIIYFHGNLSVKDMVIPGLIAKAVSMTVMMLNTWLLGDLIFGVDNKQPDWLLASTAGASWNLTTLAANTSTSTLFE